MCVALWHVFPPGATLRIWFPWCNKQNVIALPRILFYYSLLNCPTFSIYCWKGHSSSVNVDYRELNHLDFWTVLVQNDSFELVFIDGHWKSHTSQGQWLFICWAHFGKPPLRHFPVAFYMNKSVMFVISFDYAHNMFWVNDSCSNNFNISFSISPL